MKKNSVFSLMFFTTLFAIYGAIANAQTTGNRHFEIGYHFDVINGIENSAYLFKIENKKGNVWRIRGRRNSYFRQIDSSEDFYQIHNDILSVGFEKRAELQDRILLSAGAEASFLFDWSNRGQIRQKDKDKSFAFGTGVGVPLGVVFQFSDQLMFHLETIPTLFYRHEISDETTDQRFETEGEIQMDLQGYFVGLSYRWAGKNKKA